MSARFFKILTFVVLVHLLGLSMVWVGFSAPMPRAPATFVYEGALPARDNSQAPEDAWQRGSPDQFVIDRKENPKTNHWIELRGPSR